MNATTAVYIINSFAGCHAMMPSQRAWQPRKRNRTTFEIYQVSLSIRLLEKPQPDEQIGMDDKKLSIHAKTTVMLTLEGRIALAADALAAAGKTGNEQRKKALCEQAMTYLRPVVQA
jgi:hypothetical protein